MLGLQILGGMLQRLECMAYLWVVICTQQQVLCICDLWRKAGCSLSSRPSSGDQGQLQARAPQGTGDVLNGTGVRAHLLLHPRSGPLSAGPPC